MVVNNSKVNMLDSVIKIDDNIYLPISDMEIVYNIKISYIEETNRVVIDNLNKGMIRAIITDETDIKFKPRRLSKNIGTLKQGESVCCFYTTSKGWRKIRTSNGIIGYIKANKLGKEYILRQDMELKNEATIIQKNYYNNKIFELKCNDVVEKVAVKNIFNINKDNAEITEITNPENSYSKEWGIVTNKLLEDDINVILSDYKLRTNLINLIVKKAIENNINGVSLEFEKIDDKEIIKRFVIECVPRLKEAGISTCIVINNNIEKNDYINLVDYIVE